MLIFSSVMENDLEGGSGTVRVGRFSCLLLLVVAVILIAASFLNVFEHLRRLGSPLRASWSSLGKRRCRP